MEKLMIYIRFSVVKCGVYKAHVRWEDANTGNVIREHSREYSLMSLSDALRQCLEREVRDARAEGYDDIWVDSDEEYSTLKKIARKLNVKYYGWEGDELDAQVRRMKQELKDEYDDMENMEECVEYE
ncbi:hypothetical protein [Kyrpidia sp.]|uniref:hypothetical protein n=1 Tax=Kyrpidia sp. TaxID=2073077 RepID=UPI002582B248|nr:hypothetical protein [Kyrpidia sp.]MCL6575558.1 hypothetical protein [Kyrpidia sp.]